MNTMPLEQTLGYMVQKSSQCICNLNMYLANLSLLIILPSRLKYSILLPSHLVLQENVGGGDFAEGIRSGGVDGH